MSLLNYYELSVMIRMQLPILLSFAFLRYLIGVCVSTCAHAIVPTTLRIAARPGLDVVEKVVSLIRTALSLVFLFSFALHLGSWYDNVSPTTEVPLVCTEYAIPRVQALASAHSLFSLVASSDPAVLATSLATLKAVSDSSISTVLLQLLTLTHGFKKHTFLLALMYAMCGFYTQACYAATASDRSGGTSIALGFACLACLWQLCTTIASRVQTLFLIVVKFPLRRWKRHWRD